MGTCPPGPSASRPFTTSLTVPSPPRATTSTSRPRLVVAVAFGFTTSSARIPPRVSVRLGSRAVGAQARRLAGPLVQAEGVALLLLCAGYAVSLVLGHPHNRGLALFGAL